MHLIVSRDDGGAFKAVVDEPDDCTKLDLRTIGQTEIDLMSALPSLGLGRLIDRETALIAVGALKDLAAVHAKSESWLKNWNAMIAYAGQQGWLEDGSNHVQVHCVWRPD